MLWVLQQFGFERKVHRFAQNKIKFSKVNFQMKLAKNEIAKRKENFKIKIALPKNFNCQILNFNFKLNKLNTSLGTPFLWLDRINSQMFNGSILYNCRLKRKQNFKHTTTQEFKGRLAFGFEWLVHSLLTLNAFANPNSIKQTKRKDAQT